MKKGDQLVPRDFAAAVKDIKLAILQARAKAASLANAEALKLYFFVGGYISKKAAERLMPCRTSCRSSCLGCAGSQQVV